MSVQEHFPSLFQPKTDRRRVQINSVVRICPRSDSAYRGMWLVVKAIEDGFLTGLVHVDGEDPVLTRVDRMEVEAAERVLFRLTGKKIK
jgi:hypothetical protein